MSGSVLRTLADPTSTSCEHLTYSYAGAAEPALSGVTFEIRAGEYVGVVGPNGGGKSTLVRLLNGLLASDSGRVRVAGLDPATEPFEVRRLVGVLFQNPDNGLVAPFVEDDVAFGLENLGVERAEMRERVREAIASVGLAGYERREPHTLSGGEKQRVALAGLLAVGPEVLLLDEPTAMLDAAGRREVLDRVRELARSRTVLHVTHHLEELFDADRVLVLNGGRLAADTTPGELFSDAELLRENRLVLPTVPRLAAELGLPFCRTPEELAAAVGKARDGSGVEAR
ncbi:energy-coupling factor ABC transporter ATP-binding protein [soil metagenome]